MKTLDQVLKEKMDQRGLSPMTKSRLATLMIYLQDFVGLPHPDQQTMEDLILDFILYRWSDRSILSYLEVGADELAEELEPLKTDKDLAHTLLGIRLWDAMSINTDDFPSNMKISTADINERNG
ncbi:MAG TPA: hypothetical protein VFG54_06405 [Prolixibacteraceae bacterium]|nr:hypothetical protein [Prolixibacteraceae bacterium]